MKLNHLLLLFVLLCSCNKEQSLKSEEGLCYPLSLYMNKQNNSSQGFSIVDSLMFVAHDGGSCDVYDFKTRDFINSFSFASSSLSNHCNCINFGSTRVSDYSLPLVYISNGKMGSKGEWTCNVEAITLMNTSFHSRIVQTITLDVSEFNDYGYLIPWGCPVWLVDAKRNNLWVWSANIRTIYSVTGSFGNNCYHATCFKVPDVEIRDVVLTASDVVEQVAFDFDAYATQGGCMDDGIIYYSYGFGQNLMPSRIRAYNVDTKNICLRIDLDMIVYEELEDLAVLGEDLYINTNSEKLYRLAGYKSYCN